MIRTVKCIVLFVPDDVVKIVIHILATKSWAHTNTKEM